MKSILIFFAVVLFILFSSAQAQVITDSSQNSAFQNLIQKYSNNLSVNWNKHTGTPDIIQFSIPHKFANESKNSADLFLGEIKELLKVRRDTDKLDFVGQKEKKGIKYLKYIQVYKGLPVLGGEYVLTIQANGNVQAALGSFYKDIKLNTQPSVLISMG